MAGSCYLSVLSFIFTCQKDWDQNLGLLMFWRYLMMFGWFDPYLEADNNVKYDLKVWRLNTFWKAVDMFQGFLQKENKIVFMKVQSIKIFFLLFSIAGPVHESLIIESLINCLVKHVSDCWLFSRSFHGWLTESLVAAKVIPEYRS